MILNLRESAPTATAGGGDRCVLARKRDSQQRERIFRCVKGISIAAVVIEREQREGRVEEDSKVTGGRRIPARSVGDASRIDERKSRFWVLV